MGQYLRKVVFLLAFVWGLTASAQFSGNVQGNVVDSSGAAIASVMVTLTNQDTKITQTATSDSGGRYRFVSLPPGTYTVAGASSGFRESTVSFRLQTAENRDVPITLSVGDLKTLVEVNTQAPLLDTSDSRQQYTLDQQAFNELPLGNRNPTALASIVPGVTGGLNVQTNVIFAPENQIDTGANGRGQNGNTYVVDGLDVTSNVRPGVVTLTPGADLVQESSVQTNTYSVEYGRGAGIETRISTKYGVDAFHGLASDYYTYQGFNARGEFGPSKAALPSLLPSHTNNVSFAGGGPIWTSKKLYFFGSYQPYLSSATNFTTVVFEDPAFVAFAQASRPNSPEVQLLTKYPVGGVTGAVVNQTAAQIFGTTGATACGTAGSNNIPCGTPVVDIGTYNNGGRQKSVQYSGRIDKYWNKDRLYISAIRNRQTIAGVNARPAFRTSNEYYGIGVQANETHTFGPNLLNEAVFAVSRTEGIAPQTGTFSVPVVNVSGITGFGAGFAQGDFYQHSYHWRDVVSYIHGAHSFRLGYEGWHGDDTAIFQGPYGQPTFTFTNLIDLINNNPRQESNLSYNPTTGSAQPGNYGFSETTAGASFRTLGRPTAA